MPLYVPAPQLGQKTALFADAMRVRIPVFVEEQNIPLENELDGDEPRCWHFVCYDNEVPVGTLRIVTPPHPTHGEGPEREPEGNYCKVGRLATLKEWRGKGVGKLMVESAVEFMRKNPSEVGCRDLEGKRIDGEWDGRLLAHAQCGVRGVWEKLGFEVDEDMGQWMEEKIMHCGMWRRVSLEKAE
ncbi:acyl-CoA N-acyltransferase [Sphaerosporella brunnea]|uniref:Acyl-CoA N-acyltransferase n=1 Tax=Sphaerosporella brunnea TaxID=1250544 RepID=A0A5J5ENL6_9PEZI|nr:acyl-CoA N-acyltransferase [Sphaerosporella brunnea]